MISYGIWSILFNGYSLVSYRVEIKPCLSRLEIVSVMIILYLMDVYIISWSKSNRNLEF